MSRTQLTSFVTTTSHDCRALGSSLSKMSFTASITVLSTTIKIFQNGFMSNKFKRLITSVFHHGTHDNCEYDVYENVQENRDGGDDDEP